jgi:hypothetical protein
LPKRLLDGVLSDMEAAGRVRSVETDGVGAGWMLANEDVGHAATTDPSAFLMHWHDPLVLSRATELKQRHKGMEVLQHLLIDGEFRGVVVGHWRIGPHDIEDVVLDLPDEERERRRGEILSAVAHVYRPPRHNILAYAGEPL